MSSPRAFTLFLALLLFVHLTLWSSTGSQSARLEKANAFLEKDHSRFVKELIAINEIPAPPFQEARRGKAFAAMLRDAGLSDLETDAEGNVMGLRRGSKSGAPLLAVAAHLDTVFPKNTDVKVKRNGTILQAPGVGDNTRSLALMLTLIRAMNAANIKTQSDILFVASVGEEGEGDLRGVKYLFNNGKYRERIENFIAIEGVWDSAIVTRGLGSKRYRVTFNGPGGHSFSAFGSVNPAYALANAVAQFASIRVPNNPPTTYNVGILSGGTSVNTIPRSVSMEVDMRSESQHELDELVARFRTVIADAVAKENAQRSTKQGAITAELTLIGDRPSSEISTSSPLVQVASSVLRDHGIAPVYEIGSTDANIPMSKGISAITIGAGKSGRAHSPDEWTDIEKTSSVKNAQIALAIILKIANRTNTGW